MKIKLDNVQKLRIEVEIEQLESKALAIASEQEKGKTPYEFLQYTNEEFKTLVKSYCAYEKSKLLEAEEDLKDALELIETIKMKIK